MRFRGGRRRWTLPAAAGAAAAASVLLASGFLLRDEPRRFLERALANRLRAEVRIGGFSILGLRQFSLREVEVRKIEGLPQVERFFAEEVGIEGWPREIGRGKIGSLRVVGAEVRLVPQGGKPASEAPPLEFEAGRIILEGLRAVVETGAGEAEIALAGELWGAPGNLSGSIVAGADRLALAPLAALVGKPARTPAPLSPSLEGEIEGLEARALFSGGGEDVRVSAHAHAIRLETRGTEPRTVFGATLDARISPAQDETKRHLFAIARLPFAPHLSLDAKLDRETSSLLEGRARAAGVDLGALAKLAGSLPPGAFLEGIGEAELERDERGAVRIHLAAGPATAGWPLEEGLIEGRGLEATLEAELGPIEGGLRPVRARLGFDCEEASGLSPSANEFVFPVRAELEGVLRGGPVFEGRGRIRTARLGRVVLEGSAGRNLDLRWAWPSADIGTLVGFATEAGWLAPERAFRAGGKLGASGTVSGSPLAWRISSKIALEEGSFEMSAPFPLELSAASGSARLRFPSPGRAIALDGIEGKGILALGGIRPLQARIEGSAELDPRARKIAVLLARADLSGLGVLATRGSIEPGRTPFASFDCSIETAGFEALRETMGPLVGELPTGFELSGSARARLLAEVSEEGRFSARGGAATSRMRLSSSSGDRVVEGLETDLDLAGEGSLFPFDLSLDARGRVGGFELLWGSLYADGSSSSSDLSLHLEGSAPAGGPEGKLAGDIGWSFPEGPRLRARFERGGGGPFGFDARLEVSDLGRAFERYVRGPLGGSLPAAENVVASGSASIELSGKVRPEGGGTISGRASLRSGSLEQKAFPASISGVELDLPLALDWDGKTLAGPESHGFLSFERAAIGGLSLGSVSTPLAVRADTIELGRPIEFRLLGGSARLERLRLLELLRPSRRIVSSVRLERVALAPLSELLALPKLDGTLDGFFPSIEIGATEFESEGGGEIAAFGGTIRVRDLSGRDLFSRYPKLRLSASFEEIDLGQVTRTFEFGEMTGIVRGEVEGLELFRGTPVRFEARIESVRRKGVSQKIAVKAIQNLAILGTGGPIGLLDRGIRKLFDRYTYEKLGLEMKLDQDAFFLRGLARRGDRELFLKGGFPFPIDIVNADPGRAISFRSMLERLRSVEAGGIRTGRQPDPRPR